MDIALKEFVSDFFQVVDIPFQVVRLPKADWSWLDQGLRTKLMGIAPAVWTEQVNRSIGIIADATVYHRTDIFQCTYTCLRLPDDEGYALIGPILFERITDKQFDALFQTFKLPKRLREPLRNYYCGVCNMVSRPVYESLITLLTDRVFGKGQYQTIYQNEDALDERLRLYDDYLRIPEEPFESVRFIEERIRAENALIRAVIAANAAGAIEQAAKITTMPVSHHLVNETRDMKNYTITLNTLLCKAAEQAGVHPIHIDSLSNSSIRRIEQLPSAEQCRTFLFRLIQSYCQLIREHNLQSYSLPVRKAITFAITDLTADLSLKSLAEQINVNASYLSSLFRKEVGITLTEYVNRYRVAYAQMLLLQTEMPIKAIAVKCGISDLNYFIRLFKRIGGVTPKVYREKAGCETWHILGNIAMSQVTP